MEKDGSLKPFMPDKFTADFAPIEAGTLESYAAADVKADTVEPEEES